MTTQTRKGLRLWPAWLILLGAGTVVVWVWVSAESPFALSKAAVTLVTAILTTLLLLLWWLAFSRARWWARLVGLAVVVGLVWTVRHLVEVRGFSGDLTPRVAWRDEATPPLEPLEIVTSMPPPPATASPSLQTETADPEPVEGEGEPDATTEGFPPVATPAPPAPSFPQFLGPNRNAVLRGVHLAPGWNTQPPVQVWRRPMGVGWAGFAAGDGLAVTQEQRDGRAFVVAYDLETGAPRWSQAGGGGFQSPLAGDGPRATPTLHEGRVYAYGVDGWLRALDLASGQVIFERDVLGENNAKAPMHGLASSPLVIDGLVVVVAGGPNGRSLVAYDAETGVSRWGGGDDGAGYSSPMVATLAGVRQIVVFNLGGLVGHDPTTGEVLWKDRWPDRPEKVSQPVVLGDDRLFVSMGYGIGGRLVQITRRPGGGLQADVLWETRRLKAKFTQVVEHEGFLYGLDEGVLVCLDPADGERRWKRGRYGHGQILLVEDLLLLQAENGEVVLIDPNPEELVELARVPAVDGKTWATPTLVGDLLIVRSEREAACYRLPTEPGA
ncbi:MAG: PQQ-like beta-propeller repeat protein [Acidobacteriota bacterium]|jgi:outer membrane protein assembly factor BamB